MNTKPCCPLIYPFILTPDTNGALLVGFPDVPEANSTGDNTSEALTNAEESLRLAFGIYFSGQRQIPMPSSQIDYQPAIVLSSIVSIKILLWNEMLSQGLRKADVARLLNVHAPQIDRLFDINHSTKLEFIEQAANALGKQLYISFLIS